MNYWLIYIIVIFSIPFIIYSIINIVHDQNVMIKKRLNILKKRFEEKGTAKIAKNKDKHFYYRIISVYLALFKKIGVEITEKEIGLLSAISFMSFFLLIFLITSSFGTSIFFGIVGIMFPYGLVTLIARKRLKNFEKLFGDALSLMANTLRSGFSFRQTLKTIETDMPSPICDEFAILNQEMNWGLSLSDALENFAKRLPNEHVELFVTAVLIQSEVGGSLSNILGKISESINSKQNIQNELKVLTAQGKVSGIIVGVMPVLLGMVLLIINPSFILPLFTTQLGIMMLSMAVFLEVMGLFIIKLIVNID